jgi:hypothetical protein
MSFIYKACGLPFNATPTILFEDNAACIKQIQSGFIKGDRTKHIDPKFFYTSDLNGKELLVTRVNSNDNLADILTKSLGRNKHWNFLEKLNLRSLSSLLTTSTQTDSMNPDVTLRGRGLHD